MAIAFNAATDGGNNSGSTSSLTFSHTCSSGSDRLLVVAVQGDTATDDVTGVTYNGVSMTQVNKVAPGNRWSYLFYLLAPATGANNVVVSASSSHYILAGAADYTGVAQTGQPDNNTTNTVAGSSLTTSLTTVADNCWTILKEGGGTGTPGAGTGSTRRTYEAAFGTWGLFDSNGPITPAGSYSMTTDSVNPITHVMASFSPATGGGGNAVNLFTGLIGGRLIGGLVS